MSVPSFARIVAAASALVLLAFVPSADDWEKDIVRKLKTYQTIYRQEKLFVQTDRPIYVAGEELWFSAFLLEGATHLPNRSESVLYVELVKPSGATALKQIFKLQNGRAWGSISIGDNLAGGEYHLVAYTNWMRNFGSEFFFRKNITVVGAGKAVEARADQPTSDDSRPETGPDLSQTAASSEDKLYLTFYPEGGDMVAGVNCRVAFEGLTQYGKAANFQGSVLDGDGSVVASFSSIWEGRGYFMINPEQRQNYRAVVHGPNGSQYVFGLPKARSQGYQLNVEGMWQSPDLIVTVSKVAETDTEEPIFLLGLQNGVAKVGLKGVLSNGVSTFRVSKNDFSTGIVQLTLFDAKKTPCCERLVFVNNHHQLNLSVREVKMPDTPRGQAEFELFAADNDGKPVAGDFAISVTDALRIPDAAYRSANMVQYLALTSNLPGNVSDPSVFFDNSRKSQLKTELLMMTNGWRRYNWKNVLADTLSIPAYLEEPGIYVQGRLLRKSTLKQAPPGLEVTMFVSGKMQVFSENTGPNGDFTFLLRDFHDTLNAVVQTKNKMSTNADYVIDLTSNLKSKPTDNYNKLFLRTSGDEAVSFIPTLEKSGLSIEKGTLKSELVRALKNDFFVDTTDVAIDEVTVTADRVKSAKEKLIGQYGAPDYGVNKKQIESMIKQNPWQYGLMSVLGDAIPGLYVDLRQGDNINPTSIGFRLTNKMPHRFFIYVDGEMVGASNDKGVLTNMLRLYSIDELVSMDPEVVASVELTFPKKGKDGSSLHAKASMSAVGITDVPDASLPQTDADAAAQTSSADVQMGDAAASGEGQLGTMPEVFTSPEAILAIYTINGAGLHAKTRYKGIVNISLQGFSKVKEFYQPNYLGDKPDKVTEDRRNTLAWLPNVKTDSLGRARFAFFTSDVATRFRLEVNGLSASGVPGSLVHVARTPEFKTEANDTVCEEPAIMQPDMLAVLGKNLYKVLKTSGSPVPYIHVAVHGKEWATCTNSDGCFAVDTTVVAASDKLVFSKAGCLTQVADLAACAKAPVVMHDAVLMPSSMAVADILKQMQQKRFANRNPNNFLLQGTYREQVMSEGQLMRLSDYTFEQKWPSLANTAVTISTRLTEGRRFRTENSATAIGFEPQNKYNDAVPLMDPAFLKLSFVDPAFVKNYDYKLQGKVDFQGRTMYMVEFDQSDKTQWVFYTGRMLVDSATHAVAWASWKVSPKALQWAMPDVYLASGGEQSTFKLLDEHNEITYAFNGQFWVPQNAVCEVRFLQRNVPKSYVREMVWTAHSGEPQKLKGMTAEQMKRRTMLLKQPAYNPQDWRKPWFLLPNGFISDQVKYLYEVTMYNEPREK